MIKRFLLTTLCTASLLGFGVTGAHANEYADQAKTLVAEKIQVWIKDPKVLEAVKAQNAKHAGLDEATIIELDNKWRSGDENLVQTVLGNELSVFLKGVKDSGEGLYTEIFVMDNKGLNVGQSDPTSDYWQGDEAKWKETYLIGPDAIHLSDIEEDESTQTFQMQISIPVLDESGAVIGAATIAVDAEQL